MFNKRLLELISLNFKLNKSTKRSRVNSFFIPECIICYHTSLNDENIKFSNRKYKKYNKYIRVLIFIHHR